MSVYIVSGGGYVTFSFLSSLSRGQIPDSLYERSGRMCRLLTPARAKAIMVAILDQEDSLFAARKTLDGIQCDLISKEKKLDASTKSESHLAPYRLRLANEKKDFAARLESWDRDMGVLVGKFRRLESAVEYACNNFWTDVEMREYHGGLAPSRPQVGSVPDLTDFRDPSPDIPRDWLVEEQCSCSACSGGRGVPSRRLDYGCLVVISLVASRYQRLFSGPSQIREAMDFVDALMVGQERSHWESIFALAVGPLVAESGNDLNDGVDAL